MAGAYNRKSGGMSYNSRSVSSYNAKGISAGSQYNLGYTPKNGPHYGLKYGPKTNQYASKPENYGIDSLVQPAYNNKFAYKNMESYKLRIPDQSSAPSFLDIMNACLKDKTVKEDEYQLKKVLCLVCGKPAIKGRNYCFECFTKLCKNFL